MSDAAFIVRSLGGRARGRRGLCRCPAHPDRRPSLSVAEGRDGRLLLYYKAGCPFGAVLDARQAKRLVRSDGPPPAPDPDAAARWAAEERRERAERVRHARAIWRQSLAIGDTLAEAYLRARRIRADLSDALRFLPEARHREAGRTLPAMVAPVMQQGEAEPVAVHLTYVDPAGRKANVVPAKRMVGPVRGAAVPLSDGPGPLVVAEGIETAASVLDVLEAHRPRVLAALSTGGMACLVLPTDPAELVVAPDPDRPGWDAAERLAGRAKQEG